MTDSKKKHEQKSQLQAKYTQLLKESYQLSRTDAEAGQKIALEANEVAKLIDKLSGH